MRAYVDLTSDSYVQLRRVRNCLQFGNYDPNSDWFCAGGECVPTTTVDFVDTQSRTNEWIMYGVNIRYITRAHWVSPVVHRETVQRYVAAPACAAHVPA